MSREIKFLNLYFPHGVTVKEAQEIAQKAQDQVRAGISSGGFTPLSKYGCYVENCDFSKDSMSFEYGYDKKGDEG